MHLIIRAAENNPDQVLGRFKEFTSKQLQQQIRDNPQESRREWLQEMFKRAASENSNVKTGQFWQHNNKPIELWSEEVTRQKLDYIHNNPVIAGFITKAEEWKYSSAADYYGGHGQLQIDYLR